MTNTATAIINWFGISDPPSVNTTGARTWFRPLLDEEHVDACSRFKYFMITYCKLRYYVNDVVAYNEEGTAKTVGLRAYHMMSDTKKDNLYASSTDNLLSSREDYECA